MIRFVPYVHPYRVENLIRLQKILLPILPWSIVVWFLSNFLIQLYYITLSPKEESSVTIASYEKKNREEWGGVCGEFLIQLVDPLAQEQEDQICTLRK